MHLDSRKIHHLSDAISSDLIKSLLHHAQEAPKDDATVGKIINGEYVTAHNKDLCAAKFVDYTVFSEEVDKLIDDCKQLAKEKFDVATINHEVHFLCYGADSHYWPHIDGQYIEDAVAKRSDVNRDLACVTYLNDDYEGGEVYFPFFDIEKKPKAGDMLMYPGNWPYLHGVRDVQGMRYAVVVWFHTSPEMYQDEAITQPRILQTLTR